MKRKLSGVLPGDARAYRGEGWVVWGAAVAGVVLVGRSLAHVVLEDGGAGRIAGLDVSGRKGWNLVAIFGQWGLSQLLAAVLLWVVLLRYRGLLPLMMLMNFTEVCGRMAVGRRKPLRSSRTPPGVRGNFVMLPLFAVLFWWSLPGAGE